MASAVSAAAKMGQQLAHPVVDVIAAAQDTIGSANKALGKRVEKIVDVAASPLLNIASATGKVLGNVGRAALETTSMGAEVLDIVGGSVDDASVRVDRSRRHSAEIDLQEIVGDDSGRAGTHESAHLKFRLLKRHLEFFDHVLVKRSDYSLALKAKLKHNMATREKRQRKKHKRTATKRLSVQPTFESQDGLADSTPVARALVMSTQA
jgi:hypothetical protein